MRRTVGCDFSFKVRSILNLVERAEFFGSAPGRQEKLRTSTVMRQMRECTADHLHSGTKLGRLNRLVDLYLTPMAQDKPLARR
jgi:hypothetical protein